MTAEHARGTMSPQPTDTDLALLDPLGRHACDQHLVDHWLAVTAEVSRIQRYIDRKVERSGIAAQWGAALHLLLRADRHRMPMTALARELSMTSGGFTKLADRMVTAGLIGRRGSAGDRRVIHVVLTAPGLVLARQTSRIYREALQNCLDEHLAGQEDRGAGRCGCDGSGSRS